MTDHHLLVTGLLLFFAHTKDLLYEDVRRHIFHFAKIPCTQCACCGAPTESKTRMFACFLRGTRLCFTCWHRAKWPVS